MFLPVTSCQAVTRVRSDSIGTRLLDAELVVVLAAHEVVGDADVVTAGGQVHSGGPPEVAVAAENQDPHQRLSLEPNRRSSECDRPYLAYRTRQAKTRCLL